VTSSIRYDLGADGIVLLTLDAPNEAVNTMNAAFQADLAATLARITAEKDKVTGVILTSAKSTFFAGGDLRWLITAKASEAAAFFDSIQYPKAQLRGLEKLGRPVVAAMNGSALGGGLELALSCHYRVCLNLPKIEIGFPEVTLGLLPGGGGVTKASRLMGLLAALPYLTEGKRVSPAQALKDGLIHAVVATPDELMASARAFIAANPNPLQPWDNAEYRVPGGGVTGPAVAPMLSLAPALINQKTRGNFPAPEAILSAAVEGLRVDFETALRIESRYFVKLATDQVSKNMIGTFFFQMNEVKSGKSRPAGPPKWKATKVGILGAGMMGAGIAWACAQRPSQGRQGQGVQRQATGQAGGEKPHEPGRCRKSARPDPA
jgi:3-hydroxyacyl-CoA dehydrogenase / enoyl-CoA hydratase / 3-hydroxybutyryl-CoA epimerase